MSYQKQKMNAAVYNNNNNIDNISKKIKNKKHSNQADINHETTLDSANLSKIKNDSINKINGKSKSIQLNTK
jgi:hypothetical protein